MILVRKEAQLCLNLMEQTDCAIFVNLLNAGLGGYLDCEPIGLSEYQVKMLYEISSE